MGVELRVNNETYTLFKQIDGVNSRDTFAGEVRIIISQAQNNNSVIKMGDLIEVFLDGVQRFTGYAEKVTDTLDIGSHDVAWTARDIVSDLIDSFVPKSVKSLKGVSRFSELVQLCIDGLGLSDQIKVIDKVGATFGSATELISAETGQKVGDYLQENARVVQVFLNTDGKGNVLIQQNLGELKTILLNIPKNRNNNVKMATLNIDNSQRYNKYIVYSNSSLVSDNPSVRALNRVGEAVDDEIRKSRVFEVIASNPMTTDQCIKAAQEEANIRRARSFAYNCEVAGFSANGELWEPGKEVFVRDTGRGLNGKFLINEVGWSGSDAGDIANLSITFPDKNTVEANPNTVTKRTTQGSSTYGVQSGDTLSQIAKDNGVTTDDLVAANPQILNRDLILPGQAIRIPVTGGSD